MINKLQVWLDQVRTLNLVRQCSLSLALFIIPRRFARTRRDLESLIVHRNLATHEFGGGGSLPAVLDGLGHARGGCVTWEQFVREADVSQLVHVNVLQLLLLY